MNTRKNAVIFSWSGGKDASMALHTIQTEGIHHIDSLLTTINGSLQRVTMHGVPAALIEKQAQEIGLPLFFTPLPDNISMEMYSEITKRQAEVHKDSGIYGYVYGDINLEDLRAFREKELSENNLVGIYPLWEKNTLDLAREFIKSGFKAIVVTVSSRVLDKTFVGREFDAQFLRDLPSDVDPCGENGEFHTFVYDGPIFSQPIPIKVGDKTYKNYSPSKDDDNYSSESDNETWDKGFWFCDLQTS